MRSYEVMIILDPEVDDRQVSTVVENHLKPAVKSGAIVTNLDVMGRRRFAYDIKKRSEGTYVVVNLDAEPDVVKELDRRLSIDDLVLRAKVFRPDAA
jgi:small subunit ribosomal protein S6